MHSTRAGVSCFAASAALLVVGAPAAAAPKPITGTLSKPGYTVIALAANGKAKAVRARRGKFRLVPPAAVVTLHLRTPRGIYAGPVLVSRDRSATRVILGVKAGARLSRVAVGRGYASLKARLARKSVDRTRWARARKGVPIGNGRNFGRVRSKPPRARPPGDRDADGVPDVLDIDDDGDLILDDLDRSTAARATQALDNPLLTSSMNGGPSGTPNANIPGADDAQIDAAFSGGASTLLIGIPSGGST